MAHIRQRNILPVLLKHAKHFPVVGLIGVRQCGKSVLLREIVSKKVRSKYMTLDSKQIRSRAQTAPDAFSETEAGTMLIIDEVQKVPDLFDSIKYRVDERRIPGSFLLSGSTQFSRESGIRESLTGRISILNLHPMVSSEIWEKDLWRFVSKKNTTAMLSLGEFEIRLRRGGMPGMCFIRDDSAFSQTADLWLETSCFRDLQQVRGRTLSGELAQSILTFVAQLDEPSCSNIAARVHKDTRTVNRYLSAFETIRVVHRIEPHPSGIGKAIYVICDTGLAYNLGAKDENLLRTLIVHETLSKIQQLDLPRVQLQYFRLPKQLHRLLVFHWPHTRGAPKDLVISVANTEAPARADFSILEVFQKKAGKDTRSLLLTQTQESYSEREIEVHSLRA